jgi:hypothetical protein
MKFGNIEIGRSSMLDNSLMHIEKGKGRRSSFVEKPRSLNIVFISDKYIDSTLFLTNMLGRPLRGKSRYEKKYHKKIFTNGHMTDISIYDAKVKNILNDKAASVNLEENTVIILLFDEMTHIKDLIKIKEDVIDIHYTVEFFWLVGINSRKRHRKILGSKAIKQMKNILYAAEYYEVYNNPQDREKFWNWVMKKKFSNGCFG